MSRYIEADAFVAEMIKDADMFDKEAQETKADEVVGSIDVYRACMESRANGIRDAIIATNDAPSIDIVRCGECKWQSGCMEHRQFKPDDFCSYGERSE